MPRDTEGAEAMIGAGVASLVLAEDVRGQQVDAVAQREADEAELGREERDLPRGSGGVVEG